MLNSRQRAVTEFFPFCLHRRNLNLYIIMSKKTGASGYANPPPNLNIIIM